VCVCVVFGALLYEIHILLILLLKIIFPVQFYVADNVCDCYFNFRNITSQWFYLIATVILFSCSLSHMCLNQLVW